MTNSKTTFTITAALALTLDQLQALPTEALKEVHETLKASPQKKASRKADLIAGILKGKSNQPEEAAETEEDAEQMELLPVENSAKKAAPKMKMTSKTPRKPKVTAATEPTGDQKAEMDADAKFHGDGEKADEKAAPKKTASRKPTGKTAAPKKEAAPKSKSLKRVKKNAPDVDAMTPEQLKEYAKTLTAQIEVFPEEIAGAKTTYSIMDNFETVKDMQKFLIENPMRLYVFADEKLDDDLTQFLVLFADEDVIVLLDRNRERNTTLTVPQKNFTADTITFDKMKFQYSFYRRA